MLGIAGAGSALAQTSAQHQGGVGVVGLAIQRSAKALAAASELPALPQRITDIE